MIKLNYNDELIETKFFTFPDGTRHVKIIGELEPDSENSNVVEILAQVSSSDDIMDILLLKDAVERAAPVQDSFLFMPYMLGSRQDRVMVEGEPLSVKVYADMINMANFTQVAVLDPHSPAAVAALNSAFAVPLDMLYDELEIVSSNAVVVSPDAGALKRATDFAVAKGIDTLVKADKTRDLASGRITDFNLYATEEQMYAKNIYIVDDIVTNGGTFLGLNQKILNNFGVNSINLVITHADHGEGLDKMAYAFDDVYTTNSKRNYETTSNVHIVDIFNEVMN